jgi:hypothetical protein
MNKQIQNKSDKCIHILDNSKCNKKAFTCYGGHCNKHKDVFLLKGGIININHFTSNIKDYKLCDLKKYCNTKIYKCPSKFKKDDYFKILLEYQNKQNYLLSNIESIHKIQSIIRRWYINNNIRLRGLAYINRTICNNDEDFYTYEPIQDIESKYFFSYKDTQNNYWGFDIRSLKKLLDMNYNNPYTTEQIPETIKIKVNNLIEHLNKNNVITIIDNNVVLDRKTMVKQKFVDIFSQMEYVGYSCDIAWVMELNNSRLKRLYRELEDIWNYRANLSETTKRSIVPPDGRLCSMPVSDYNHCNVKVELQEILANELLKICGAINSANMNLGFMYFIISLSFVSRPCFIVHNWVQSVL